METDKDKAIDSVRNDWTRLFSRIDISGENLGAEAIVAAILVLAIRVEELTRTVSRHE
jgi:hypothetical protein